MREASQISQLKVEPEYPGHAITHYTQNRSNREGRADWIWYNDRDELTWAMSKRKCKGRKPECVP